MKKGKVVLGFVILFSLYIIVAGIPVGGEQTLIGDSKVVAAALTEETQPVSASALSEGELYAKGAVLLDGDSGRVLYGKNALEQMPMASTTKIMTCILVLELLDVEETVEVSSYAASMPAVKLSMKKGESYRARDLLCSLMLESHNDTAVALAEHVGKKQLGADLQNKATSEYTLEESKAAVAAFAKLMNEKAKEIGCENTWFITPNGLDATQEVEENGERVTKTHSTTATDLARIMRYCLYQSDKRQEFLEITRMPNHSFTANGRSFSLSNHNALLTMVDGAVSGKTGFTGNAGYCYVGALERDGKKLIVALLACGWPNNKTYKWQDSRKLLDYGLSNYTYVGMEDGRFHYDSTGLPQVLVLNAGTNQLDYQCLSPVELREGAVDMTGLLLKEGEEIQVSVECEEVLEAPVSKGQVVGRITYSLGEEVLKTDELVLSQSFDRIDYNWCFEKVLELYFSPDSKQSTN